MYSRPSPIQERFGLVNRNRPSLSNVTSYALSTPEGLGRSLETSLSHCRESTETKLVLVECVAGSMSL